MSQYEPPQYGQVPPSGPPSGPPQGPPPGAAQGYPPPPPGHPAQPGYPPQPGYGGPGYGGPGYGGPGYPGQPGQPKGSRKGLWITLAVLGVVVLAGLVVTLVLLLTGDDDTDKDGDKDATGATGNPATVVGTLLDAGLDGDCDAGLVHLTEEARASDPCASPEFEALASGEVTYTLGDAEIDGDAATVPVTFTDDSGDGDYDFTLEAVDGDWLVSGWERTSAAPTDEPTPTEPTDDATTAVPSGESTADAVPNEPAAVAEALYRSTLDGDCATANDLVTDDFKSREGDCDPSDFPSEAFKGLEVEAGEAVYNAAGDEATVPVDLVFAGESFATTFTVIEVDGQWLVDNVEGDM